MNQLDQSICIIAAMSGSQRVIGKDNGLPWIGKVKGEMKHFRKTTSGGTVVMGRKTYDSIGMPLPRRNNIVISRDMPKTDGVDVCRSIEAAMEKAQSYAVPIYIIGGAGIYEQTMDIADRMILSYIKEDFKGDTFFPEISDTIWSASKPVVHDDFRVVTYTRKR
jgi:dihydrofolate reductase